MLVRMVLASGFQAGKHARFRSGGDDDILGLECLGAGFRFHLDSNRSVARAWQDRSVALHPVDLVLLHQELDALGVFGDDLVLAVEHLGVIQARIFALDALFGGVHEVLPQVGGVEQRLGGDAADVQASSAQLGIFFNNRGLQAVLAGADRRGVATRTTPNHNQVISHFIFQDNIRGSPDLGPVLEHQPNWMNGERGWMQGARWTRNAEFVYLPTTPQLRAPGYWEAYVTIVRGETNLPSSTKSESGANWRQDSLAISRAIA